MKKEVIVVDTNSTDKTVEIAKSKGAKIVNEPRRGYGRAYKTGFAHARGDIIVTLDGDMTYPAEKINELVDVLISEDLDFISCDRLTNLRKNVMSFQHRFGNRVLTISANLLFRLNMKDSQSGMWVFRRTILDDLELTSDKMSFSEEIKIETQIKGFKFKEIPIDYKPRKGEVKLRTWQDGLSNLKFLFLKKLQG
jgi:hypothetical protein